MAEESITANAGTETVPTPRAKNVTCGFCGCTLAADGGIVKTSEYQQKLLRSEDKLADANREVEKLLSQITELKSQIPAAPNPGGTSTKKFGIR